MKDSEDGLKSWQEIKEGCKNLFLKAARAPSKYAIEQAFENLQNALCSRAQAKIEITPACHRWPDWRVQIVALEVAVEAISQAYERTESPDPNDFSKIVDLACAELDGERTIRGILAERLEREIAIDRLPPGTASWQRYFCSFIRILGDRINEAQRTRGKGKQEALKWHCQLKAN